MKRRIAIILLLLTAGAIVNLAVAWGCAIRQWSEWRDRQSSCGWTYYEEQDAIVGVSVYTFPGKTVVRSCAKNLDEPSAYSGCEWTAEEIQPPWCSMLQPLDAFEGRNFVCFDAFAYGWPARSLMHTLDSTTREVIYGAAPWRIEGVPQWLCARRGPPGRQVFTVLLPVERIPPGFIINTLFYALLLWLLVVAPFTARRMLRRRRGQCEKCAYPIGVSPVCTECGAGVRR